MEPGFAVAGYVVIDRRGRLVDGDERWRQRLSRSPAVVTRLRRLARRGQGWVEHVIEPGLRARTLVSPPDGELVVFLALQEAPRRLALDVLSPRERAVASHLRAGRSDAWVARRLGISVGTVRWHLRNVCRKAGLPDRGALLAAREVRGRRPRRPAAPASASRAAAVLT